MTKMTYLRKSQTPILNKFDALNPLYRTKQSTQPSDSDTKEPKEAKRKEKILREQQVKAIKDSKDAIKDKMEEKIEAMGTTISNNILKGMETGFLKLAEVLNLNNQVQQPSARQESIATQPSTVQPTDQDNLFPVIPEIQFVPTIFSQEPIQPVHNYIPLEQHVVKLNSDYDRIIQRMSTLPPGQTNLNWSEHDP